MKPVQHTDTVLLYNKLCSLRQSVLEQGGRLYHAWQPHIERSRFLYSAWNLALYLALRCHDLRPLQKQVLPLGLSSLGRGEARTNTKNAPDAGAGHCGKSFRQIKISPKKEHEKFTLLF